jgi:hypothetical protein
MTAVRPHTICAAALGLALAGCLSVPGAPQPMCHSSEECDQASGEVCEEGVCWGNPPPGPFAALISPPGTRHDLAPQEIAQVAIPSDGWMGDLVLEAPLVLTGRITEFCPTPMTGCDTTIGATITVSRPSQFHGGPGFKTIVDVDPGAASFSIPVPRPHPGDDPYVVTIVPDGGSQPSAGRSAAEHVPPLRLVVSPFDGPMLRSELGGADLPTIAGRLLDSAGRGLAHYRVAALGHWDLAAVPVEVSTVSFTDANGDYSVTLSDHLVGTVEIVARPIDPGAAPIVHITNFDAMKSSSGTTTMLPTSLGALRDVPVQVTGVDLSGIVTQVSGALVTVTGVLPNVNTLTSFTVIDQQVTNSDGSATLHVLDGPGIVTSYRLTITPPANSQLGVLFDQKLSLSPGSPMRLGSRISLRGTIRANDGKPLSNVAVTARPSLRFLWTLDAVPQAFVAAIPAATAVTLDTGEFVLWVDANVAQIWGHYDLLIEPPAAAQAPTYLQPDIEIPRDGSVAAVSIGEVTLPDAAYIHGRVLDPTGTPVDGAELKMYLVSVVLSLCTEVAHAPTSCPIPASVQGRGTSEKDGRVGLSLPR